MNTPETAEAFDALLALSGPEYRETVLFADWLKAQLDASAAMSYQRVESGTKPFDGGDIMDDLVTGRGLFNGLFPADRYVIVYNGHREAMIRKSLDDAMWLRAFFHTPADAEIRQVVSSSDHVFRFHRVTQPIRVTTPESSGPIKDATRYETYTVELQKLMLDSGRKVRAGYCPAAGAIIVKVEKGVRFDGAIGVI